MMEPSTIGIDSPFVVDERGDERGGESARAIYAQPHWYAVYTCANHERSVSDQLESRGVEHFLPQYESVRRWRDRKIRLRLPLFPGYVFVYLALQNRLRVLQVPGVVRLVGFDGHPAAVPQEEVARVRQFLNQGFQAEPHKYLQSGRRVRLKSGPLEGMEGIIVRRKNRSRLVISFELIQRSMAVEIDEGEVEAVSVGARQCGG
jgi:transcription antitermination factor NusG